jgi:hypothetical protein
MVADTISRREANLFGLVDHRKYPLYAPPALDLPVDLKWKQLDKIFTEKYNNDNLKKNKSVEDIECFKDERLYEKAEQGYFDKTNSVIYGDLLMENIMNTIGSFKFKDSPLKLRHDQQTMIAHCLVALLPLVYGPELNSNRERLLKKFNLKRIYQEIVIIASRRVGKSILVACFLAALLLCMPGVNIACFSPALRQARGTIMKNVLLFIKSAPGSEGRIARDNSEFIEVKVPGSHLVNTLSIFPDREEVCYFFLFIYFLSVSFLLPFFLFI